MKGVAALAAAVSLVACASAGAQTPSLFAYEAAAPLDVRSTSDRANGGVRVVELTYATPKGGRVPATLVVPASAERAPAVVFQHGAVPRPGGTSRRRPRTWPGRGSRRSSSTLFNRPPFRSWLTFQLRDRAAYVQNVVDLRRAIDLLAARQEIDADRIALAGFSYGGVLAGIVAGIDPRLAAVVVMSGPGRITDVLRREGATWVESAPRSRRAARRAQLTRYLAHMRAVDAVPYVGTRAPMYFQFGRQDAMPRAWFAAYLSAAPVGKRASWYPAGHTLCDCATRDRKAWLLRDWASSREAAAAPARRLGRVKACFGPRRRVRRHGRRLRQR